MKRTLAFLGILALLLTITAFGPAPAGGLGVVGAPG